MSVTSSHETPPHSPSFSQVDGRATCWPMRLVLEPVGLFKVWSLFLSAGAPRRSQGKGGQALWTHLTGSSQTMNLRGAAQLDGYHMFLLRNLSEALISCLEVCAVHLIWSCNWITLTLWSYEHDDKYRRESAADVQTLRPFRRQLLQLHVTWHALCCHIDILSITPRFPSHQQRRKRLCFEPLWQLCGRYRHIFLMSSCSDMLFECRRGRDPSPEMCQACIHVCPSLPPVSFLMLPLSHTHQSGRLDESDLIESGVWQQLWGGGGCFLDSPSGNQSLGLRHKAFS